MFCNKFPLPAANRRLPAFDLAIFANPRPYRPLIGGYIAQT
jgi:hypothetical protein